MRHALLFGGLTLALAAPALADEAPSLERRLATVEQQLATSGAPSERAISSAVDAYLASAPTAGGPAALVGGPGSAGYDGGFWIRGGSFLLRTQLTIQTRYEAFLWNDRNTEPSPGGDLSGFSVPRATLRLSGDATCKIHYYAQLEFGHPGSLDDNENNLNTLSYFYVDSNFELVNHAFDVGNTLREGWIEYEASPAIKVRMGLVQLPTTRQMMTPPELQQFVDISLASVFVGHNVPGYTDRNRDYGLLLHGALGCDEKLSYLVSITNGDGTVHRNVVDGTTDDNLAYGARVNYDLLGHIGYEEGALRQSSCGWVASVGAWAWTYHDVFTDNPHVRLATRTLWGVDAALGHGGFSMTVAYTSTTIDQSDLYPVALNGSCWLVQAGYLFPDTAWEVAARWSGYTDHLDVTGAPTYAADELAGAITYYIDGIADKLTLDVSFIAGQDDGSVVGDVYAGYNAQIRNTLTNSYKSDAMLFRFQWQLAL